MLALVRITRSGDLPKEVEIRGSTTIGRTPDSLICLPASSEVSRQHAMLVLTGSNRFQLVDLGSSNGTLVDGNRVTTPVELKDGSRIEIADYELTFVYEQVPLDAKPIETTTMARPASITACILVCDIRNYCTFSETIEPAALAPFIGLWFREAGAIVENSGGVIDKFIGDAILAFWPEKRKAPGKECLAAVTAGKQLLEAAAQKVWPLKSASFEIAVAMHHGAVSYGNIGLNAQRDATILGDAVNTTFRIESVMKPLERSMVCSEVVADILKDQVEFVSLGRMPLKGKAEMIRLFTPA